MQRYLAQKLRPQALRVIDALEAHGSVLKAAGALGVSQPALTKSLRDIEEIVGARLFDRHPRGVTPTDSGMVLVRSGRRILAELRRTEEELDHLANPFGGVAAIGALPVSAAGLVPAVLMRLKRDRRDFKIRIEEGRTEELLPLLAAGQLDLVVGRFYEPSAPDGFNREQLWLDPMAIVARTGHPLLASETVTLADLGRYELVTPVAPQRVAAEIDAIIGPVGLADAPTVWSTSYAFTRELLLGTDAYTITPPMVAMGDIGRGALGTRRLPIDSPSRPAGIITARGRMLGPAARAFIDCLHVNVARIVEEHLSALTARG